RPGRQTSFSSTSRARARATGPNAVVQAARRLTGRRAACTTAFGPPAPNIDPQTSRIEDRSSILNMLARTLTVVLALATALAVGPAGRTSAPPSGRSGPARPPAAPPWFEDVTDAVGLNFTHDCGPTGTYFMPQSMYGGVALFDADGDGR